MIAYLLLSLLCLLIPPDRQPNEEVGDTLQRYATIAGAIADRADSAELQAYLLTVARHESSFNFRVHTGEVRGDAGRSWGLYQIMVGKHPTTLVPGTRYRARSIVGTGPKSTARATDAAAIHLERHIAACGANSPRCVFSGYGGVPANAGPVTRKRITARVNTWRRVVTILRKANDNE